MTRDARLMPGQQSRRATRSAHGRRSAAGQGNSQRGRPVERLSGCGAIAAAGAGRVVRASAGLLAVFLVERLSVIGPGLTVERAELLHLVRIT